MSLFIPLGVFMPKKGLNQKAIKIKKQKYKVSNWSDYNNSLKMRGDIEVWLPLVILAMMHMMKHLFMINYWPILQLLTQ